MTAILQVSDWKTPQAKPLTFLASKGTVGSHSLWETSQSNQSPSSRSKTTTTREVLRLHTAAVWPMWSTQTLETMQAPSISRNMMSLLVWQCALWKTKSDLESLASASWKVQLPMCSSLGSLLHHKVSPTKSIRQFLKAMIILSLKHGRHLSSYRVLKGICRNGKSSSFPSVGGLKVMSTFQASNCKTRQIKSQMSWVKKSILLKRNHWEMSK